jgi:hypothetical protein
MEKRISAAVCIIFAPVCVALLISCDKGETIDGYTTEHFELYTGEDITSDPHNLSSEEKKLYDKVKTYFNTYYKTYGNGMEYTTTFDPSERGTYSGDECYVFRSFGTDGTEGFLIAASVDGESIYGYEPSTGLFALIWCDGWTEPDFSYFGGTDLSGL